MDTAAKTYRTSAGNRWSDVIRMLDPKGFSPAVMQSNSDFGVGSTFCVNAHGWPVPHGPFGSTVKAIRMVLADGTLVQCSRNENAELFTLAMGGYGLFGISVELDVEMTPNLLLEPKFERMSPERFAPSWIRKGGCSDCSISTSTRMRFTWLRGSGHWPRPVRDEARCSS